MNNVASVKDRLKNKSIATGKTVQELLTAYGFERTIFRLSKSQYASNFTLKGGIFLYAVFNGNYSRATTDIDLLAQRISNDIAPGIIVTPLAIDEFNGPRGEFYKNMFAKCPVGRPGTADEVANVAELLMSDKGAFITGSTFLIDGGATSSYYYGPLQPKQ